MALYDYTLDPGAIPAAQYHPTSFFSVLAYLALHPNEASLISEKLVCPFEGVKKTLDSWREKANTLPAQALLQNVELLALASKGCDLIELLDCDDELELILIKKGLDKLVVVLMSLIEDKVVVGQSFDNLFVAARTRTSTPDHPPWNLVTSRSARGLLHPEQADVEVINAWFSGALHGEDARALESLVDTNQSWNEAYRKHSEISFQRTYTPSHLVSNESTECAMTKEEIAGAPGALYMRLPHLGHNVALRAVPGPYYNTFWWVWEGLDIPPVLGPNHHCVHGIGVVSVQPTEYSDVLADIYTVLYRVFTMKHPREYQIVTHLIHRMMGEYVRDIMSKAIQSSVAGNLDVERILAIRLQLERYAKIKYESQLAALDAALHDYGKALFSIDNGAYAIFAEDWPNLHKIANGRWWGFRAKAPVMPPFYPFPSDFLTSAATNDVTTTINFYEQFLYPEYKDEDY